MVALVSFQLNRLTIEFFILFTLLIVVAFLKEKQRVFVWISIAYFFGEFLHLYANRFLNEMNFPVHAVYIAEKLLLLFPILCIIYVRYKFKQNITIFHHSTSILQVSNKHRRAIFLLLIILALSLLILLLALYHFSFSYVGYMLLYAAISSMIEEILWRSLLMQSMQSLTNNWMALTLSSIAYGCSYLMYGYSIEICLVFALSGFLYGWITIYYKRLVPSIICHFFIFIGMIVSGIIPFSLF